MSAKWRGFLIEVYVIPLPHSIGGEELQFKALVGPSHNPTVASS